MGLVQSFFETGQGRLLLPVKRRVSGGYPSARVQEAGRCWLCAQQRSITCMQVVEMLEAVSPPSVPVALHERPVRALACAGWGSTGPTIVARHTQ